MLIQKISQLQRHLNPASLRVRLTIGIAVVSALGLGCVSLWISWRMQRILIATHKDNIEYIGDRFPHDVAIYHDMVSLPTAMQKAINNLTNTNTLLWVKGSDNQILAQSISMKTGIQGQELFSVSHVTPMPELYHVQGRDWLLCATPLQVKQQHLGTVYIAQDISEDQTMFLSLMGNLILASILAIEIMTIIITLYIRRSLKPLQSLSQLAQKISPDQLGEAQLHLENAPREVKELAHTWEQMLARIAQAWEHQRQLVSNVSHELRTPLTIVSGYLQSLLRRGDNLTAPQREALEIAISETDRTIQLMQNLLDLARADTGYMHLQMQPIILNKILQEVAQMVKKYSDHQIQFKIPLEIIQIKADPDRLKQILVNLIDNAVKYSDSQETITIHLKQQKGKVNIDVCDRGIGIPLAQQSRIFERFYRVDEARSRGTGGAGIGLSIVKTLVEGMGGQISVQSQLGEGSTFTLTFPA